MVLKVTLLVQTFNQTSIYRYCSILSNMDNTSEHLELVCYLKHRIKQYLFCIYLQGFGMYMELCFYHRLKFKYHQS